MAIFKLNVSCLHSFFNRRRIEPKDLIYFVSFFAFAILQRIERLRIADLSRKRHHFSPPRCNCPIDCNIYPSILECSANFVPWNHKWPRCIRPTCKIYNWKFDCHCLCLWIAYPAPVRRAPTPNWSEISTSLFKLACEHSYFSCRLRCDSRISFDKSATDLLQTAAWRKSTTRIDSGKEKLIIIDCLVQKTLVLLSPWMTWRALWRSLNFRMCLVLAVRKSFSNSDSSISNALMTSARE